MSVLLILLVCRLAAPFDCHEERRPNDLSAQGCLLLGQPLAADWIAGHPAWRLAGWRCASGREA